MANCSACRRPLLAQDLRGPIVTVPASDPVDSEDEDAEQDIRVERYHHACFKCGTCGDSFGELEGKANFVRENGIAVHVSVNLLPFCCVGHS